MEVSSGVTQQSISVIFLRQKASFPQLVKFSLSYNDEKLQTFFQEFRIVSRQYERFHPLLLFSEAGYTWSAQKVRVI